MTRYLPFMLLMIINLANAHEMRPALLQLKELDDQRYEILFRQPIVNGQSLGLSIKVDCPEITGKAARNSSTSLTQTWQVQCTERRFSQVYVDGLSRTITDVLVQVTRPGSGPENYIIKPAHPILELGSAETPVLPVYLVLGVEHLLAGLDHVLFIVGLMLLIRDRWKLVQAVTAFTVAHSMTLALSSFDLVRISQAPVEATIALSILYLAVEITRDNPATSVTARFPWSIAFVFGLLHGLGFAGVLRDIGLPQQDAMWALLLFNLGIEAGQLMVITLAIVLLSLAGSIAHHVGRTPPWWAHLVPAYIIGATSVFWLLERVIPV